MVAEVFLGKGKCDDRLVVFLLVVDSGAEPHGGFGGLPCLPHLFSKRAL